MIVGGRKSKVFGIIGIGGDKSLIKIFERYDRIEQNVLLRSIKKTKNSRDMFDGLNKYRELTFENNRKISELQQLKKDENEKTKKKGE